MQWVYNPYALPLLAAAMLACALAIYAWRRRSVPGAIPFIILVLATAWWSVGYALELSSGNLVWMVRWAKFEYLGITLVPLSWLIFTLRYTKQTRWLEPRTLLLLGIIPAITVTLVWTNELHGLIWREVQRNTLALYPTLDVTYGPMFWVNLLYAYALLLTGTILIFRIFLQAPLLYRRQAGTLLAGAIAPWLGNLIYLTGAGPANLDLTPFSFTLAGLLVGWGLFRYRLLDILPVAHAAVIDSMADGVLVVDALNRVVEINPAAQKITRVEATQAIGEPALAILPPEIPNLAANLAAETKIQQEITLEQGEMRFTFDLLILPLQNRRAEITGRLIVFHDITDRKRAERELQKAHDELELRVEVRTAELQAANQQLKVEIAQRRQAEAAARESEALYRSVVDTSPDAITLTNLEGQILVCNPQTVALHRYEGQETLVGKNALDLVAPAERERAEEILSAAIARGQVSNVEISLLRRDGDPFPAELSGAVVSDLEARPKAITFITRDITRRKTSEAQISRQVQRLAALRHIDMAINANLELGDMLGILINQVIQVLGVDAADVLLLNPKTQVLEYSARLGFQTGALKHTRLRIGEGYAGQAAAERRIIHVPDLRTELGEFERSQYLPEEDFVAYYAVPLSAKRQIKGVLEVFLRSAHKADNDWLKYLEILAAQAAIAIENAILIDDIQQSNYELSQAYENTLEGWARALELRDKETVGHTHRVTEVTLALAHKLGIPEDSRLHVRRGAILHDIGKMGIPDSILLKPGPLSDAEWEIMRRHPVYAYEMLGPIDYLQPALDIPFYHHEKWDGSGYPQGLAGTDIPLPARIFAVVDVWDALNSDRPYRPAWPETKVLEYLRNQSGRHFDPEVLEAFLELITLHSFVEEIKLPPPKKL